jgi:hypothetical protein
MKDNTINLLEQRVRFQLVGKAKRDFPKSHASDENLPKIFRRCDGLEDTYEATLWDLMTYFGRQGEQRKSPVVWKPEWALFEKNIIELVPDALPTSEAIDDDLGAGPP